MSWLTRRRGVGGRSGVVAESEAEVQESACDTVVLGLIIGPRSHLAMVLGLVTVIQRYRTELNQSVERDLADVSTGRQLLLVTPTHAQTSFKTWRSGHISWHGAASTSMVYEFARISFHSEMKMCSPKCRQIWNSKLTLHEKIKSSQFSKKNYILKLLKTPRNSYQEFSNPGIPGNSRLEISDGFGVTSCVTNATILCKNPIDSVLVFKKVTA